MSEMELRQDARVRGPGGRDGDRSIMERIHAGDSSALDELLERYWNPLVTYSLQFVPHRDAAEDIVQEAVVKVWKGRTEWTPTHRLQSFLYRIVRNLALNERKRHRIRRRWMESQRREPRQSVPTPLEVAEGEELRSQVDEVVQDLPPKRREVFVLSRYHGRSYREIAEIMDISPQTVANQMTSALDELRQRLRPQIEAFLSREQLRVIPGRDGRSDV